MPTLSPQTTPYYGGGQVKNPADVLQMTSAPSTADIAHNIGTLAVNTANGNMYGLVGKAGGTATWAILGGATGAVATLTGSTGTATPSGGNIQIAGTANQVTTAASGATVTLSLPNAITAPGSITATTTITATLGNITATNGNLSLATAGNKIAIATGANASIGTATLVGGTVTVSTTAVTASSLIFVSRNTAGGTPGNLNAPTASIVAGTSFVINSSSGTDTSTVNWWIVN